MYQQVLSDNLQFQNMFTCISSQAGCTPRSYVFRVEYCYQRTSKHNVHVDDISKTNVIAGTNI